MWGVFVTSLKNHLYSIIQSIKIYIYTKRRKGGTCVLCEKNASNQAYTYIQKIAIKSNGNYIGKV
jgi:hypothetical protein